MSAEKLSVVSPVGTEAVARARGAPRLADLNGKRVCELWNGVFKGDVTFPVIRRLLKERYPGIHVIPYTEFPHAHGADHPSQQREHARRVAGLVKEKGGDALISGNGA
jgi:hypothetical protein